MAEKEESEADVQFVEEGVLVMEAERTLSSRFSDININNIHSEHTSHQILPQIIYTFPHKNSRHKYILNRFLNGHIKT